MSFVVVPAMGDAAEGFAVHLDTEFAAVFVFSGTRPSTRPTGAPNRPSAGTAPLSSPAMSAAERAAGAGDPALLAW